MSSAHTSSSSRTDARPWLHQRGVEIQAFGSVRQFPLGLSYDARMYSCQRLNRVLADTQILYALYKKHHWLVRGATFYQLHLLLWMIRVIPWPAARSPGGATRLAKLRQLVRMSHMDEDLSPITLAAEGGSRRLTVRVAGGPCVVAHPPADRRRQRVDQAQSAPDPTLGTASAGLHTAR
jgi:hypothetical protein